MKAYNWAIHKCTPRSWWERHNFPEQYWRLKEVPVQDCDTSNLCLAKDIDLAAIMRDQKINQAWNNAAAFLSTRIIPDSSWGVNPGDRRALFYLIFALCPRSVLETGTHVAASTTHIAAAMKAARPGITDQLRILTVDILDVNDPREERWFKAGVANSPQQAMKDFGFNFVEFKSGGSLNYLQGSTEKFDAIFLDGDHDAWTVYKEAAMALKKLNPGGIIILHDYFPNLLPLWNSQSVIAGPEMALRRLRREARTFRVVPLGNLPWGTKLGSNVTSLAIMVRI